MPPFNLNFTIRFWLLKFTDKFSSLHLFFKKVSLQTFSCNHPARTLESLTLPVPIPDEEKKLS